jgi:hypothetical protein
MSIMPPETSAKYSLTLPCGSSPVEKNSWVKRAAASAAIALSGKSTSTTTTRTGPRSGARSSAARRATSAVVPTG